MATKKVIDKTTDLGFLGKDYQANLVKYFIEERDFFARLSSMIEPNVFTDDNLRKIVSILKRRYDETSTVPNYMEIDIEARSTIRDEVGVTYVLSTLEKLKKMSFIGIDIVRENAEQFFKQQELIKAMNKANDIIAKGDFKRYDEIQTIFEDAVNKNRMDDEEFFHPFDGIDEALSEDYRSAITTGSPELDDLISGGLAKGELGIIIAPSNVGKTSSTTGFAAAAAIAGYKVLHVFFEDRKVDIKRKYMSYISNIESCTLSQNAAQFKAYISYDENGRKEFQSIQENVYCFHGPTGDMSTSNIQNKINNLRAMGIMIDMVVVDYFEAIKLDSAENAADNEYTREGLTMRSFERMAHKYNVAIWVPVQGSRDSYDKDFVGMNQGGGSIKKVQIGHVVLAFASSPEQKEQDLINIFLHKFRGGRIKHGGALRNVLFNKGTCHFDMTTMTKTDEVLENMNQENNNVIAQSIVNEIREK